jgi:hypothetical protein
MLQNEPSMDIIHIEVYPSHCARLTFVDHVFYAHIAQPLNSRSGGKAHARLLAITANISTSAQSSRPAVQSKPHDLPFHYNVACSYPRRFYCQNRQKHRAMPTSKIAGCIDVNKRMVEQITLLASKPHAEVLGVVDKINS